MTPDVDRENNELLQFLYACPVGLIQADMTGKMTMLNPVAMELLHRLGTASGSMDIFAALQGCAPELRLMAASFPGDNGQVCQGHRIHVGHPLGQGVGNPLVLACTIVKLGPTRLVAMLEDVSERVAQERRLKQADAWFASLLHGTQDFAVLALDAEGRIQAVDAVTLQQTGFDEGDLVGSHIGVLDRSEAASTSMGIVEEINSAKRDGWHLAEGWCATRDGDRYRCQRLISVRADKGKADQRMDGYTVILRPVTQGCRDTEQLRRRLTTDHLTGACNRAHFFDIAEEEIRRCANRGQTVGLICVDIDHFKAINDTHGHSVGDLVLTAVARACMDVLRPSDTFARLGGEEFTAILPCGDPLATLQVAELMRAAIAATSIKVDDLDLRVTASLGFAVRPAAAIVLAEMLQRADQALYAAKRTGRNRVVASEAMATAA